MRTIKFRAWDSIQEQILPVENIDFRSKFISIDEGDNSVTDSFEMFELMQFTGVYDKNGAEIYEGDIVRTKGYNRRVGEWVKNFEVVFSDTGFYLKDEKGEMVFGHYSDESKKWLRKETVIGNIYENKDLLKV